MSNIFETHASPLCPYLSLIKHKGILYDSTYATDFSIHLISKCMYITLIEKKNGDARRSHFPSLQKKGRGIIPGRTGFSR